MLSDPLHYWIACVGLSALLILWIFLVPIKARAACSLVLRPNWLSFVGAIVALVGYFYFFKNEEYDWTMILMSLSGGLDLADGRIARAYVECGGKHLTSKAGFWAQMNHRGTTALGAKLDPGMDKVRLAPIFVDVCLNFFAKAADVRYDGLLWLLYLGVALIVPMLLVDLGGQALRSKIFKRWRRRSKKKQDDNKATLMGKAKALAQWLWLPVWAAWDKGLLPEAETYLAILNVLMLGVLLLTIASLLSKMRPLKKLWKKGFPLKLD
ncbi:MAG: CDP-alcohol phosphatidyltransferase family protein [Patescibacteria group bacterium]